MSEKCREQALFIGKFQVPVQGRRPNALALATAKPDHEKVQTRLCMLSKPNHTQGRVARLGARALA